MTTRDPIKVYEEYDDIEECISMVQKKIDALKSDIACLCSSFKDNVDLYMIGLSDELGYYVRIMDSLLDNKAQVAKKLANLRKENGDF